MNDVGHLEILTVSNSADLRSFLLIMCIDAKSLPETLFPPVNFLDGEGRHHFSVGENAALRFSFDLRIFFASLHAT